MRGLFVSIIIPVKEISNYLRNENLPAFITQIYKNFEVIVLRKWPKSSGLEVVDYKWNHGYFGLMPQGQMAVFKKELDKIA